MKVTMLRVHSVLGLCIQLQLANSMDLDSESKNGLCVIEQGNIHFFLFT